LKTFGLSHALRIDKHFVTDEEASDIQTVFISDSNPQSQIFAGSPGLTACCGARSYWWGGFLDAKLLYEVMKYSPSTVMMYHGNMKDAYAIKLENQSIPNAIGDWNLRCKGFMEFTHHPVGVHQGIIVCKITDVSKYLQWKVGTA